MYIAMFNGWYFFWLIFPAYILVTPLAFLITLPFDGKSVKADLKKLFHKKNKTAV